MTIEAEALALAREWLRKRWEQTHPNEGHVRQLADYAAYLESREPEGSLEVGTLERIAEYGHCGDESCKDCFPSSAQARHSIPPFDGAGIPDNLLADLNALVLLVEGDVGELPDEDDDESVGSTKLPSGEIVPLPMTFGHVRRARIAIDRLHGHFLVGALSPPSQESRKAEGPKCEACSDTGYFQGARLTIQQQVCQKCNGDNTPKSPSSQRIEGSR